MTEQTENKNATESAAATPDVNEATPAPESPEMAASGSLKHKRGWLKKIHPLFALVVVLPTLCSLVYFSVWASDQYASEATFVVRSSKSQASLSGLGAILQTAGIARAQDDTYTVQEYMRSRAALAELEKDMPVRSFYEKKGDIFSRFNGFGLWDSKEAFYQYYEQKVHVGIDGTSGIATLSVQSFSPEDSRRINVALLNRGEAFINQLNDRARSDTVSYAQRNVDTAKALVQQTSDKLTAFRIKNGVYDLKAQSEVQIGLISKLQDQLIALQTQLDQVRAITPDNPQIPGLLAREKSLKREIRDQLYKISGDSSDSTAKKAAEYQWLTMENGLAEKQLAAAMTSLESAKAEAARKQLYLEVVSQPSLPDMAEVPRRLYNIIATFVISLMVYGVLRLLGASIREHKH